MIFQDVVLSTKLFYFPKLGYYQLVLNDKRTSIRFDRKALDIFNYALRHDTYDDPVDYIKRLVNDWNHGWRKSHD